MRVLTWNLFHGRSLPPAGRALAAEFAMRLDGWKWDVALLQEVPPWWPALLARMTGAEQHAALTSRNAALTLRQALAERWPDSIKSNGGGCNAILARTTIAEHRAVRLRIWPERRVAQLVRLGDGTCLVNFHGSTHQALAESELERLWKITLAWAGDAPVILGGDLNLRSPRAPEDSIAHIAHHGVDHLFARGLESFTETYLLDRRVILDGDHPVELSDHAALMASHSVSVISSRARA